MIYRVFSDYSTNDRILSSTQSWQVNGIQNIPIKDNELNRHISGLPFLKDILDIGYNQCKEDNDIILYTNSDIGIVTDNVSFPSENFFCVRKNVDNIGVYTISQLSETSYEDSVNCDIFGITKKWYRENKKNIPDFNIGSPTWDICMLYLLNGVRINNICYHVKHDSEWKNGQHAKYSVNKSLFFKFCENSAPEFQ
jgi:hypothetical protein